MTCYAIIESNTGFVWAVVDADDALAACYAADRETGGRPEDGQYEPAPTSDLRSTRGVYDVREAPAGFDVDDGQDATEIERVQALPRAGIYGLAQADE